jgi:hypothetical protein
VVSVLAAGVMVVVLAACTGRGGGQLPAAAPVFMGPASFGFSFSCERSSKSTSPKPLAGRLRIQVAYVEHGVNPLGSGFAIHGTVDVLDPVLESEICIGQNPPPTDNELIFLGRFTRDTSRPAGFPASCPTKETGSSSLCRFEIIVRDNDMSRGPSQGDAFAIRLSSATAVTSDLDPTTVFYARAGLLSSGNLTVD